MITQLVINLVCWKPSFMRSHLFYFRLDTLWAYWTGRWFQLTKFWIPKIVDV